MRDRHEARLCRRCEKPMARQQPACWSCGTRWASEQAPPLRLIRGGGDPDAVRMVDLPLDVAVAVALPVPVVVR